MKKGSPGGILAIAVGVLFLSLGWTGRYEAVWEALRTGEKATAGTPEDGGLAPGGRSENQIAVTVVETGEQKQADIGYLSPGTDSGMCSPDRVAVKRSDAEGFWCIKPANLAASNASNIIAPTYAAGQVESEDYAYTQMPNGTQAFRYQPNAIGYFDA